MPGVSVPDLAVFFHDLATVCLALCPDLAVNLHDVDVADVDLLHELEDGEHARAAGHSRAASTSWVPVRPALWKVEEGAGAGDGGKGGAGEEGVEGVRAQEQARAHVAFE